jgi:hypothetical protein
MGVAVGCSSIILILFYSQFSFALKGTPIDIAQFIAVLLRPVLFGLLLSSFVLALKIGLLNTSTLLLFLLDIGCALIISFLLVNCIPPFHKDFHEICSLIKTSSTKKVQHG